MLVAGVALCIVGGICLFVVSLLYGNALNERRLSIRQRTRAYADLLKANQVLTKAVDAYERSDDFRQVANNAEAAAVRDLAEIREIRGLPPYGPRLKTPAAIRTALLATKAEAKSQDAAAECVMDKDKPK